MIWVGLVMMSIGGGLLVYLIGSRLMKSPRRGKSHDVDG